MAQMKDDKTSSWMYYGSYVDAYGKRIQYKKRGFASKKLAKKAEDNFRDQIENYKNYISFKEVTDEYLLRAVKDLKESSYVDAKSVLSRINSSIGDIKLMDLDQNRLQAYIDELDNRCSKRYVEKLYYTINKIISFALDKGYIGKNPLQSVKMDARKNEIVKEMLFWEPTDFRTFISFVDSQMYKVIFSFLYYMGTRKGEALALTWNDIDLTNNTVKINKSVSTKLNNKITTPKTSNSNRTITMPKHLSEMLVLWKEHEMLLYEFDSNRFLFGYHNCIPAETLRRNFSNYIAKVNSELKDIDKIPVIRIHDLRHSHASYLINNMSSGFTDFDIAKRLGDTVSTLHSTYAHWFKSADKNIIDFMDKDIIKTPANKSEEITHTKE